MIVEMHCHTAEHSACSHVTAVDLVRRASEVGIQTVVLTDHHYQWSEDQLSDLRRRAGLLDTFLILAGQEVETYDFGHVLVYGAKATIPAIDFESSYQLPRAFDVGTFLAQYVNMFLHHRQVQRNAPPLVFLRTYLDQTQDLEEDFMAQVDLYRARTCLSILYYLAKLRMGDSENFWRVLVEAERSLAAIAAGDGVGLDNRARLRKQHPTPK